MQTDKELVQKIGENIKKGRLQSKLTQQELAGIVGISRPQLARIEKTGKMTFLTLVSISRALNLLEPLFNVFQVPELNAKELFLLEEKKQKMVKNKPKRVRKNGKSKGNQG